MLAKPTSEMRVAATRARSLSRSTSKSALAALLRHRRDFTREIREIAQGVAQAWLTSSENNSAGLPVRPAGRATRAKKNCALYRLINHQTEEIATRETTGQWSASAPPVGLATNGFIFDSFYGACCRVKTDAFTRCATIR